MHRHVWFLEAKRRRLFEPHVANINAYAQRLETRTGKAIPAVDPDSGGQLARVLLLFESPSRKGVQHGSGMISCDNDDVSASNVWEAHRDTGLPRQWCIAWNIVPWYVGTEESNEPPTEKDLQQGSELLLSFIELFPDLKVVIPVGKAAAKGLAPLASRLGSRGIVVIDGTPHPSPRVFNRWPWAKPAFYASFERARDLVSAAEDSGASSAETAPAAPLFDLEVIGRPATFATVHERAWKAKVADAFESAVSSRPYDPSSIGFRVRMRFRMPAPQRASEAWDLDNLIKPTLDAMEAVFGRREGKFLRQPADDRVVELEAAKRTVRNGESPGAEITVWQVQEDDDGAN